MDLRIPAIAATALAICMAPASAATYSWPIQLSQPVSITALPYTTGGDLIVVCSMHIALAAGGTPVLVEGTGHVPVQPANGPVSYSGNLAIPVGATSTTARPPQTGDDVSCVLRVKANGTFTNVGNVADYRLP